MTAQRADLRLLVGFLAIGALIAWVLLSIRDLSGGRFGTPVLFLITILFCAIIQGASVKSLSDKTVPLLAGSACVVLIFLGSSIYASSSSLILVAVLFVAQTGWSILRDQSTKK